MIVIYVWLFSIKKVYDKMVVLNKEILGIIKYRNKAQ